jgi:squalene-associated FAD-dependent desaturase
LQPKKICIIGGGIAGLSAAVFLASKLKTVKVEITIFEASPKLGGRAYSFFDKDIGSYVDNGQHILASWFQNTLEFLEIIGSLSKLNFQEQLKVCFHNLNGRRFRLEIPMLISPLNLIAGIMKFDALKFRDKLGIIRIVRAAKRMREDELRNLNTDELFRQIDQSEALVANFWKPLIVAVFNANPEETSALLFVRMLRIGFLNKGSTTLFLPGTNLNNLYVEPSIAYLKKRNVTINCSNRIRGLAANDEYIEHAITERDERLNFDYYISAVPFFEFNHLFGDKLQINIETLRASPIVNIHHVIDYDIDEVMKEPFVGILDGTIQWVFKTGSHQICTVISSAKDIVEADKDEIIRLSIDEVQRAVPSFRKVKFIHSKVIKEKRATFVPDKSSLDSRPNHETKLKNFFIAGDWTNTGYPCIIESAVTSGKKCAELISKIM